MHSIDNVSQRSELERIWRGKFAQLYECQARSIFALA